MKVNNVFAGRPAWYDRNPLVINGSFVQSAGPHGITQRTSYTVPTGRKAMLENVTTLEARGTAATTAGFTEAWIRDQAAQQFYTDTTVQTNGVGDRDRDSHSAQSIITVGVQITGNTQDTSIGGTFTFTIGVKLTEFDA